MALQLICGYTQSGKTTLCSAPVVIDPIREGEIPDLGGRYHQIIYCSPDRNSSDTPNLDGVVERPFAAALKEESHERLGLKIPRELWDVVKDKIQVRDPVTGQYNTIRHYYLEYGSADSPELRRDPDHWTRKAFEDFDGNGNWIASDWRKIGELENTKALAVSKGVPFTTWRVYRSSVPIPGPDSRLEHDLDRITTDLLCVQSPEEFVRACELFPQYREYVPKWITYR